MYRYLFHTSSYRICDKLARSISSCVRNVNMSTVGEKVIRLPTIVKPVNYKLDFVPNFSDFTFNGVEHVELEVSSSIQKYIELSSTSLFDFFPLL